MRATFKNNYNITIDLIDNNVYYWKVCFKNFSNNDLRNSLNQNKDDNGVDFIEVHFSFHDKFYPGYPPFIKVIQPTLSDSLMHRITNMRMVQFEYWNPTREIEFMINKLYKVLNEKAKIDTNNETIDYSNNPLMVELDSLLTQLIALCDIKDEYEPLDDDEDYVKVYDKNNNKTTAKGKTYWKSGVGYGHDNASTWDINEYVRLQKEKDLQIQSILQRVLVIVQDTSFEDLPLIYNIFQTSYMVQFFKSYLQGTTILEMNKHRELYNNLFAILQYLANDDGIYLFYNKDESKSLFTLLKNISIEAKQVIKISKSSNDNDDDDVELNLPLMVNSIFEMIETPYITYLSKMEEFYKNKENNLIDKLHTDDNPEFVNYVNTMNPLKYDMVSFLMDQYKYTKNTGTTDRKMTRRLATEFSSLSTSLPIFYQSSIFVRINEQNIRNIKVLITGPEDTPYDSGVFIFDVYIDDNYPDGPPKMYLKNTGGIRFNPNLYIDGKVCLTLLGTWGGGKGEGWNKDTSTLQQLFVSVQSQILVDMPVFNEPGHERDIGNSKGDSKNFKYNQYIRYYNICHAMIDMIENVDKYKEFKDVILNHFKLKKDYILKISKKWCEESVNLTSSLQHHQTNNKEMFENKMKKLEEVLNSVN
jgi:ubiquitin-protein ligase